MSGNNTSADVARRLRERLKQQAGISDAEKEALGFLKSGQSFEAMVSAEERAKREAAELAAKQKKEREEEEARKALLDSLGENQFLLSSVTSGRLPKSGVDHVMTKYDPEIFSEAGRMNIPKVNEYYWWDADLLEALWLGKKLNQHVLLVGPPGTGKTTATQQFAAWIGQPFARFNGKEGLEPGSILGTQWAEKGEMTWKDGLLTQAVRDGWYTDIDEIFKMPPGIQMAMQSLYEKDGFLILDEYPGDIADKYVYPSSMWNLVATDNTKGMGDDLDLYGAGQQQDISSLDRFGITYEVKYLPPDVEVAMITKKYKSLPPKDVKKLVSFAGLVRNSFLNDSAGLNLTMSPRGLMAAAELMLEGLSLATALQYTFISKLGDDQEINVAKGFIKGAI